MTNKQHNEVVLQNLKAGDLVTFDRVLYTHWGVYVGDHKIVHKTLNNCQSGMFASASSGSSMDTTVATKVVMENFWEVAGKSKANIRNHLDMLINPLPTQEIVGKAMSKIGETQYNLFDANCEHFANWCRYGLVISLQVPDPEKIQRILEFRKQTYGY